MAVIDIESLYRKLKRNATVREDSGWNVVPGQEQRILCKTPDIFIWNHNDIVETLKEKSEPLIYSGMAEFVEVSLHKYATGDIRAARVEVRRSMKDESKYLMITAMREVTEITFSWWQKIRIWPTAKSASAGGISKRTFFIYESGDIMCATPNSDRKTKTKYWPCRVEDMKFLPECMQETIYKQYSPKNKAWKDLIQEPLLPLSVKRVGEYYNKKDYVEKITRTELPSGVNRMSLREAYVLGSVKRYTTEEEFAKIYNHYATGHWKLDGYGRLTTVQQKKLAGNAIKGYLVQKMFGLLDTSYDAAENALDPEELNLYNTIDDYIDMSIELMKGRNRKIIVPTGKNKLIELHDKYADKLRREKYKEVKLEIPETPMKYLKMPAEFEMITEKEALFEESDEQHNCVVTYFDRILKGYCAIFKGLVDGHRLTIEVYEALLPDNKGQELRVRQCLEKYNKEPPVEVVEYVRECVKKGSKQAYKEYKKALKANKKKENTEETTC